MTENYFQDGPHLVAALICQAVLEERDGTKSAIRILDRVTHGISGPGAPDIMPPFEASFQYLARIKTGKRPGKHLLKLQLVDPLGRSGPGIDHTVALEPDEDRGVDMVIALQYRFEQDGIHWIDLYCDDVRMTRTPLRVSYIMQKQISAVPASPIQ